MNRKVTADDLFDTIWGELEVYSNEVTEKVKEAVDVVSDEVNAEIKSHATFKEITGKYLKAFRIKKAFREGKFNKTNVWYVAKPYYRLTHLLEKGHAKRNGGRTMAFPHVQYGEELAERRMMELTKEAVKSDS